MTTTAMGLIRVSYDAKSASVPTSALYGKARQAYIFAGVQPVALTWKEQFAFSSQDGYIKPHHFYAIDRVRMIGAPANVPDGFIKFRHSDFDGCEPGGYIGAGGKGATIVSGGVLVTPGQESMEFDQHGKDGCHPVFSSDSVIAMDWINVGTNYPVDWVIELVDMGETNPAQNTGEDVNACYAACDDAQTQTAVTVVSGDSYQVASDRGNAVLRAFEIAGDKVTAGTVSAPVDTMQPNEIYVARMHPGVGCHEFRDIPIPVTTVVTATLATYSAA